MKSTYLYDQELFSRLKSGDERAFTEVYDKYWALLYAHAFKMLQDKEEAQDAVQNTFSSLWINVSKIPNNANLAGYLFTALKNKVLNQIGKNKHREQYIASLSDYLHKSSSEIMDKLNEKDLHSAIEKEISNLPPKMRQIFELSRKSYLTNKEIAVKLNLASETVKKQIHNSIKIIKLKLQKDNIIIILQILSFLFLF